MVLWFCVIQSSVDCWCRARDVHLCKYLICTQSSLWERILSSLLAYKDEVFFLLPNWQPLVTHFKGKTTSLFLYTFISLLIHRFGRLIPWLKHTNWSGIQRNVEEGENFKKTISFLSWESFLLVLIEEWRWKASWKLCPAELCTADNEPFDLSPCLCLERWGRAQLTLFG